MDRLEEILEELNTESVKACPAVPNIARYAREIRQLFETEECPVCKGNRWVLDATQRQYDCSRCNGTGRVPKSTTPVKEIFSHMVGVDFDTEDDTVKIIFPIDYLTSIGQYPICFPHPPAKS